MYRLRHLISSFKYSLKKSKIQHPTFYIMEEVQMALMEGPIMEINQFSTEKLSHISNNFRVSREQFLKTNNETFQFDGKLHLDLKVDKILSQIQQCKINLAQMLQLYLPTSSNKIQMKQLKLSNLKPSFEQKKNLIQNQQIRKNKQSKIIIYPNKNINQNFKDQQDPFWTKDTSQIGALSLVSQSKQNQLKQTQSTVVQNQKDYQQIEISENGEIFKSAKQEKLLEQSKVQNKLSNEQSQIKDSSETEILREIEKQIFNFKKTLMLREAQLGMLIFITETKYDKQFISKYSEIYGSLKQYVIPPSKLLEEINLFVLQEVFEIQAGFLIDYLMSIQVIKNKLQDYTKAEAEAETQTPYSLTSFTKQKPFKKLKKTLKSVYKLKIINSKIITMAQIFPYACIKDKNDLFSFSQSHQRWQRLINQQIITYKFYGQSQKVRKSFDSLRCNINVINASMNILNQYKDLSVLNISNWGQIFDSASKILKVALFKKDAQHEAAVMISEPDGKLAKQIWNLPENKTLQNFISTVLPAIQFSEKIFIPRALTQYFEGKGARPLPNKLIINHITQYGNQLFESAAYQNKIPCRINAKHRIHRKYETKTHHQQKQQNTKPESYSKIFFSTLNSMTKAVSNINKYFKNSGQNQSTAILHIHGGGFISMSSFIHQTYTRNWANQLQIPILSVDYGKAPQYPYPNGLYDCLEAYIWLRYVFRQIYNCEVQKVIIVGDSAGGNLAAALTTLLIEWNLPKPDGLVLVYPALNLNYNNYTPSLLHALNDMILPHTFLKICLKAYLKDPSANPEKDSLISPIQTKPQTLKKYPRTKIFVGGKDPFHDDCCRFVQKLNAQNKGIADLKIFDEFPHGFLQFDMTTFPHEQARKATKQVQNALRQIMQQSYK